MARNFIGFYIGLAWIASFWGVDLAHAGPLTLDDFLSEVRARNQAYRGSAEAREGSSGRIREAELATSPSFFANYQYEQDGKLQELPIFTYDHITSDNVSIGVSEQFDFGLKAKLYYAYDYTSYSGASISGESGIDPSVFSPEDARPVLELSLPVLGGGFGRTVRANQDLIVNQSRVDASNAESQLRNILVQAESAYWSLATSRDIVAIEERAVKEALATYDYNERKARMNLVESSDVLQSEASLENAKLSLKIARDNERSAERAFNLVRNAPAETVPEGLAPLDWQAIESSRIPKARPGNRADVDSAQFQTRVSDASAQVAIENDKPTLQLYSSFALNGRSNSSIASTLANSYSAGKPTDIVGVQFTMPLNFDAQSAARRGAQFQAAGADLRYQQALSDQEEQWFDLVSKLADAQAQYHFARIIEGVQQKKLENEQKQLRRGRSTTFQVLQFEQDFTNSQLARAQAGANALNLRSQLKLYEASNAKIPAGSSPSSVSQKE